MTIYGLAFLAIFGTVAFASLPTAENGMVLVEGDILMSKKEYEEHRTSGGRYRRMAVKGEEKRWRNATIWYTVALTSYTEAELKEMQWAFDQFEQETCLKFRPATKDTPNYAVVRLGAGGCNAQLGQAFSEPAAQSVNLGSGCRHYGLYLHEFGHTIGLYHEHQHPDRDSEIDITLENVHPDWRVWFEHEKEPFQTFGAPYDVQSVMHYGEGAFSKDGSITMRTKDPKRQKYLTPVWLKDMSFYDAWKINAMYKCASHCGRVDCPPDTFVNKECKCVTKQDFAKRRCIDTRSDCPRMKDRCEAESYWLYKYCRKTCDRCFEAE